MADVAADEGMGQGVHQQFVDDQPERHGGGERDEQRVGGVHRDLRAAALLGEHEAADQGAEIEAGGGPGVPDLLLGERHGGGAGGGDAEGCLDGRVGGAAGLHAEQGGEDLGVVLHPVMQLLHDGRLLVEVPLALSLGILEVGDVGHAADEAGEQAEPVQARNAGREHGAPGAVVAAHAELEAERGAGGEALGQPRGAEGLVLRMDAGGPAGIDLLLVGAAGEVEPDLVDVDPTAAGVGAPDEARHVVEELPHALLADHRGGPMGRMK